MDKVNKHKVNKHKVDKLGRVKKDKMDMVEKAVVP